jgi:hypothetical protein
MANKLLERHYLDRAMGLLEFRPSAEIRASETPDFLVPSGEQQIGIEVTAFYLREPNARQSHQARQGLQKIAVEQARRGFRASGGPALYVTVSFVQNRDLTKERAYALGPVLAKLVSGVRLPYSVHDATVCVDLHDLPPEIVHVSIHGSVDSSDELWYPTDSGWVAAIERSDIYAEIRRKTAALHIIRGRCDQAWLLIVNDGFRGGAPCELSADARHFGFCSPFDRTLWLESHRIFDLSSGAPISEANG